MNNQRRKEIAKAIRLIDEAKTILENIEYEEQESYDNLPESLQETERGEKMTDAIDSLSEAQNDIDNIIDNLQEIIEA